MVLQDQRVSEIVQGTCDHEQKTGSWTDLRGKSTHKGKAEKEVAANQSVRKNPMGSGGDRKKELSKESREKFLKNQEVIHNSICHQEISKIYPERYTQNFSIKKAFLTFLKAFQ